MHVARLSPREHEVHAVLESLSPTQRSPGTDEQTAASGDKGLLAIANLVRLRWNAQQVVISLVDNSHRYILAEATEDLVAKDAPPIKSRVPRGDALCENSLGESTPCPGLAVKDCSRDHRFEEDVAVAREGGVRFYAAVPVVTNAGYQIGMLAVLDPVPREQPADQEVEELKEYAACAAGHLELLRTKADCERKSKLLRAISASIEHQYPPLRRQKPSEKDQNAEDALNGGLQDGENSLDAVDKSPPTSRSRATQQALTKAFSDTAKALRYPLLADNVAIFGPVGVDRLADSEIDRPEDELHHDGEAPSALLTSVSREKINLPNKLQPCPPIAVLSRLASKHPGGAAFRLLAGTSRQEPAASAMLESPAASHASLRHETSCDAIDEELLHYLHLPGLDPNEHDARSRDIVFLPVYHPQTGNILAASFLWNANTERSLLNIDLADLHAISSSLSQDVARILSQKKESDFLSNFSHELRSPIHGVMGAAQFMQDTRLSSYQSGLVESIFTCSNTLLDTLNLVLDHTKLGRVSREKHTHNDMQSSSDPKSQKLDSVFVSEPTDLALLVEEVTESVVAGHFFENSTQATIEEESEDDKEFRSPTVSASSHDVKVILALADHKNWSVQTQPGAIKRLLMNLVGNALKYTPSGSITITLEHAHEVAADASTLDFRIQVEDTGVGMSEEFQQDSLFVPFRQENRFDPGVGLGLSIAYRIVNSMGGDIAVHSTRHEGTKVSLNLTLPLLKDPKSGIPKDLRQIVSLVKGKHLVLIDAHAFMPDYRPSEFAKKREDALEEVAVNWLGMRVSKQGNMNIQDADFYLYSEPPPADDLLERHRQTSDKELSSGEIPLIIVATDSKEAHMIEKQHAKDLEEAGRIVEVLSQPCGPRKLVKVLKTCLDRQKQSMMDRKDPGEETPDTAPHSLAQDPSNAADAKATRSESRRVRQNGKDNVMDSTADYISGYKHSEEARRKDSELDDSTDSQPEGPSQKMGSKSKANESAPKKGEGAVPDSTHPPLVVSTSATTKQPRNTGPDQEESELNANVSNNANDQQTLRGLIVDDNRVNLRLLVTLMKKSKYFFKEASDGQEALEAFKNSVDPRASSQNFDFILMDIGMPLMNGIEATKLIRQHEREHDLAPTQIIALTAWADTTTRDEALEAGMNLFLPKPVKFAQLKEVLSELVKKKQGE